MEQTDEEIDESLDLYDLLESNIKYQPPRRILDQWLSLLFYFDENLEYDLKIIFEDEWKVYLYYAKIIKTIKDTKEIVETGMTFYSKFEDFDENLFYNKFIRDTAPKFIIENESVLKITDSPISRVQNELMKIIKYISFYGRFTERFSIPESYVTLNFERGIGVYYNKDPEGKWKLIIDGKKIHIDLVRILTMVAYNDISLEAAQDELFILSNSMLEPQSNKNQQAQVAPITRKDEEKTQDTTDPQTDEKKER